MAQDNNERRSKNRASTAGRHESLGAALLDAAERTIAAGGLSALRARALAEQVGCSVGAIYTVFPDLDALILAVNGRTLAAIDQAMTRAASSADPAEHLVRLAAAYLDYAAGARNLWAALFQHAMPAGRPVTESYRRQQEAAFSHIEAPLGRLRPALPAPERALLARSLFAAVHGMAALGLDEKVAAMPLPVLHTQIATVVAAAARGLAASPEAGTPGASAAALIGERGLRR